MMLLACCLSFAAGLNCGVLLTAFLFAASEPVHAGTCKIYGDGAYTVEACDNGSYETWDSHGRHRVFGDRNAGFNKYPGQEGPVLEHRDEE